jgi:hypothetical protein
MLLKIINIYYDLIFKLTKNIEAVVVVKIAL